MTWKSLAVSMPRVVVEGRELLRAHKGWWVPALVLVAIALFLACCTPEHLQIERLTQDQSVAVPSHSYACPVPLRSSVLHFLV
jgi:hypothetical protein